MFDQASSSILCVIDLSDSSLQAVQWAIPLALKEGMHISVLHPYRLNQLKKKQDAVQSKNEIDREASDKFRKVAEGLLKSNNISFDFRSEVGFLHDRIREHARKQRMALLVICKNLAINNPESLQELIKEMDVPTVIVPQSKELMPGTGRAAGQVQARGLIQ